MAPSKAPPLESASAGAKILKSSWWLAWQAGLDMGLAFAFASLAVRGLGPAGFGLVTLVQAILNLAGQATLSLELAVIRLVPEFRGHRAWATARQVIKGVWLAKLAFAGGLALVLFGAAPLFAAFYREPDLTAAVRVGCLSLIGAAAAEVGAATCIALFRPESLTRVTTLRRVCELIGLVIVTQIGQNFVGVVLVLGLADLVAAASYLLIVVAHLRHDPPETTSSSLPGQLARRILGYCLPTAGARFLDVAGREAGKLILGRLAAPEVLGHYGIARLMAERLIALLGQMAVALVPAAAHRSPEAPSDNATPNALVRRGLQYQGFLSASLVLSLWAATPIVLSLVGGAAYAPAILATRLLAFMIFLWSATAVVNTLFFAYERTAGILLINSVQLVLTLGLYQIAVTRWQLTGAVLADVIGQGLALLICLGLARWWFGFPSGAAARGLLSISLWAGFSLLLIGLTGDQVIGLGVWLVGALGLLGSGMLVSGLPTSADWRTLANSLRLPGGGDRFKDLALYLLRRYQVCLRRRFRQHQGIGHWR